MKLEYKILWLDDNIADFISDDIIEEVENYLIDDGFTPEIVTCDNSKDFFSKLNDSYDIILTDYHMNDMDGDKVVETIRGDYSVMTEILFYTAKASLEDTKKISRVSFLETSSSLDDHGEAVLENLKELIDLTIKKTQHLNNLRGLVMAETSEIENLMKEILHTAVSKYNFSDLDIVKCVPCDKNHIKFECSTPRSVAFNLIKRGNKSISINKTNSGKLVDVIKKLLKSRLFTTSITESDIDSYSNDVKRNVLAHSFEISNDNTKVILQDFDGTNHTFVKSDFKSIRQNLKKYRNHFQTIKGDL